MHRSCPSPTESSLDVDCRGREGGREGGRKGGREGGKVRGGCANEGITKGSIDAHCRREEGREGGREGVTVSGGREEGGREGGIRNGRAEK